ncbi:ATP-binding protein [Streptomyces gougerotii]|uniref:ATP-binding protein n=1 Tax=Streptomyces gougerotii TaxID=53448 RepID=UPI00386C7116|nr:ATP-binding protein [Streptomyces gougerotii]
MSESLPTAPAQSSAALSADPLPVRSAPLPTSELLSPEGRFSLPSYVFGSPYALQVASRITQCPPPPPDLREPAASPFVYGLALPSATATPLIAHEAADAVLDVHEVEDGLVEPALELVHELAVHACRFTGAGEMIHLVLRRSDGVLQVVAHDTHAPHFNSRLARQCAERRRVSLTVVRELAEGRGGECGFAAAHPPATGVCTWASIGAGPTGASDPGASRKRLPDGVRLPGARAVGARGGVRGDGAEWMFCESKRER